MGKFDPATHDLFVKLDTPYASGSDMYLRKETYNAFKKMHHSAKKRGIKLVIRSATRNFEAQKSIWEDKWTGNRTIEDGTKANEKYPDPQKRALKILEYSSMPGSSRHHWGTDIDINMFENKYFESGEGLTVYTWLNKHADQFGFCQPYTEKSEAEPRTGYNEEKWHWTYLPLSQKLASDCKAHLKNEMIEGFLGAKTASKINIVDKYVLGINQHCF